MWILMEKVLMSFMVADQALICVFDQFDTIIFKIFYVRKLGENEIEND